MRNIALLFLIASAGLNAQPAWKEFSIGAPTVGRNQFGPFGLRTSNVPLIRVLARAYGMPEHRIIGPAWLATEKYAITAQVDEPKELQQLMQRELEQRFHMIAHREQRQVAVFVLKTLESPAKLSSTTPDGSLRMEGGPSPTLQMTGATLDSFASSLADMIRRPVFNETGIDGAFQIRLSWDSGNLKSLQAAVKNQLGLQLVDDNRTVDLLVVDHIEKLTFQQ